MIYIFCWMLSAVIGALIGNTKRKAASGAIGGMLLGPIGWLFAVMEKDERTKCPECLGAAVPAARKCIYCGSELAVATFLAHDGHGLSWKAEPTFVTSKRYSAMPSSKPHKSTR